MYIFDKPIGVKHSLIALVLLVGFAVVMTSQSRLERDAEALAEVIAERTFCNITPIYSGYDGVSGVYDFDRRDQRKFQQAYDRHFVTVNGRLSTLTIEQQKLLCNDVDIPENGGPLRIDD